MSISDKLNQLNSIRTDIRTALTSKGISASSHNFSDFASDVDDLTAIRYNINTIDCKQLSVPNDGKAAFVNMIGGKSVAWNQLVNTLAATQTVSGVTFTNNGNGSLTLSGTATADINLEIVNQTSWTAHKYVLKGCPSGGGAYSLRMYGAGSDAIDEGSGTVWDASGNTWKGINIIIQNGTNCSGLVFWPVLCDITMIYGSEISGLTDAQILAKFKADFPDSYYAYNSGSLVSADVSAVESNGQNLVNCTMQTTTTNGVTATKNSDGTYTLNGTATANTTFVLLEIGSTSPYKNIIMGKTLKLCGCPAGGSSTSYYMSFSQSGHSIYDMGSGGTNTLASTYVYSNIAIVVKSGTVMNNHVFKPMLTENLSATYSNYTPYVGTLDSISIPSSLRTAYPLRSAGSVHDEYDFERMVHIQRVGSVDLGSLTWLYDSGNQIFYVSRPNDVKALSNTSFLCTIYTFSTSVASTMTNMSLSIGNSYINIKNTSYTNAAAFKTAMSGVYLNYELATYVEHDISSYFTGRPTLSTESGGTINFTQTQTPALNIPNETVQKLITKEGKELQSRVISPSTSQITVVPTSEFEGLSNVVVDSMPEPQNICTIAVGTGMGTPTYSTSNFVTAANGAMHAPLIVTSKTIYDNCTVNYYYKHLTDDYIASFSSLEELKQSVIQSAFSGWDSSTSYSISKNVVTKHYSTYTGFSATSTSENRYLNKVYIVVIKNESETVVASDIVNIGKALQSGQSQAQYVYQGQTTVTPTLSSQTLSTSGKALISNITINPMPTGTATTPATTITTTPTITVNANGLITASNSKTQSVTPTVSAGYIQNGTAGTITVNGSNTSQLTTYGAHTFTPGTANQTISSGQYLTGVQTIKGDANLVASNIKSGVSIFGVVGSFEGGGSYTIYPASSAPSAAQTGDIWVDYSSEIIQQAGAPMYDGNTCVYVHNVFSRMYGSTSTNIGAAYTNSLYSGSYKLTGIIGMQGSGTSSRASVYFIVGGNTITATTTYNEYQCAFAAAITLSPGQTIQMKAQAGTSRTATAFVTGWYLCEA